MIRFRRLFIIFLISIPLVWAEVKQTIEIEVLGMTCPFCVFGIDKKLSVLPGVETADVNLKLKKARIVMQPGKDADLKAIRGAIVEAGFTPGETKIDSTENFNQKK